MQTYQDKELLDKFTGSFQELVDKRDDLLCQGKISHEVIAELPKEVIAELPKEGTEVTINGLVFVVTRTNEFGKVIMMLKSQLPVEKGE